MCGRFALTVTPEEMVEFFGVVELEDFPPRYNIAPTQPILMVMAGHPREPGSNMPDRRALLVRWGLWPWWAKDLKRLPLLINARSEDATEKPAFRDAMRHRRTLTPASGFFEWQKTGPKTKQAFWVRPRAGGVIAFGGLMETWHEPGGSEIDTGAILTTAANDDIRHIHDRMPVVIEPEDFSRWLNCRDQEPRDVADLMQPVEPGFFEAIPVSDRVNNHANVGQDNIEPIELSSVTPQKPQPKSVNAGEAQLKLL